MTRGTRGAPPTRQGRAHPYPPRRAGELRLRSLSRGRGGERGGPAPEPRTRRRKSPVRPGAQPPRRPGPPPSRRRPRQVPPLPQPGAHSPARRATRPISSRFSQGPVSLPNPLTFPGGSAAPPRPGQRPQFTHTASGPALSLTHTQRDPGSGAAHILCVTGALRASCARARLPTWREARWREAGGARAGADQGRLRSRLGNEVPLLGPGPFRLN